MKTYHKIQTVYKRDPDNNYKTLIEGCFSIPEFGYLSSNDWIWTEKVDGTNIRIMFKDLSQITFGGKTENAQIPSFLFNKLNETFLPKMDLFKTLFDTDVCLYGEGYGAKIQKGGGNYRSDNGFVLFDVKIGNWWLKREDVEKIGEKLDIDVVPIIGYGSLFAMVDKVRNGFNSRWGNFLAEGIVARPKIELFSRNGGRIITKIKHKDF